MRITIFASITLLFIIVSLGCSASHKVDKSIVLAEVGGEEIILKDVFDNPSFVMVVENLIKEKIIKQEYKVRNLVFDEEKMKKEWDGFVLSKAQGDEAKLIEDLNKQGVTVIFMKNQVRLQVMFQQLINDEFPVTIEDAREEFEGNLQANQRMYAGNVPEKQENPETITFDDVSEVVIDNLKRRVLSKEAQNFIDLLADEYENKGWVKNYVKPLELKDLTTIRKKEENIQEVDASRIKPAAVKRTHENKSEEKKETEDEDNSDETGDDTPDEPEEENSGH
jgi:DNA invertase Pin-like site-specific DNA recombinase